MTNDLGALGWIAGILEGEGSVRINSVTKKNLGALIVSVTSTDRDMLQELRGLTGVGRFGNASTRAGRRPAWRWTCASREAAWVLRSVLPFCRVARFRKKAVLALEFQEQKTKARSVNGTQDYRHTQLGYFRYMKRLNQRGGCPQATDWRTKAPKGGGS